MKCQLVIFGFITLTGTYDTDVSGKGAPVGVTVGVWSIEPGGSVKFNLFLDILQNSYKDKLTFSMIYINYNNILIYGNFILLSLYNFVNNTFSGLF